MFSKTGPTIRNHESQPANQPTNQPTNQRTNQPTDQPTISWQQMGPPHSATVWCHRSSLRWMPVVSLAPPRTCLLREGRDSQSWTNNYLRFATGILDGYRSQKGLIIRIWCLSHYFCTESPFFGSWAIHWKILRASWNLKPRGFSPETQKMPTLLGRWDLNFKVMSSPRPYRIPGIYYR